MRRVWLWVLVSGWSWGWVVAGATALALPAAAIVVGNFDDFQDRTTQGWFVGPQNPSPPANLPNAGPDGVGDHALGLAATRIFGSGRALVGNNADPRWIGDYTAAGVSTIVLDANNPNAVPLTIRIGLNSAPFVGGPFVSAGQVLPANSGWTTLSFPIEASDLLPGDPTGVDAEATLSAVANLRVLHAAGDTYRGDGIPGTLQLDNIESVPEPEFSVGLAAATALLWRLRHRTRC